MSQRKPIDHKCRNLPEQKGLIHCLFSININLFSKFDTSQNQFYCEFSIFIIHSIPHNKQCCSFNEMLATDTEGHNKELLTKQPPGSIQRLSVAAFTVEYWLKWEKQIGGQILCQRLYLKEKKTFYR